MSIMELAFFPPNSKEQLRGRRGICFHHIICAVPNDGFGSLQPRNILNCISVQCSHLCVCSFHSQLTPALKLKKSC